MLGFNFLSHGSQDLYPTYLEQSKGFSSHDATIATIIGNCVRLQLYYAEYLELTTRSRVQLRKLDVEAV